MKITSNLLLLFITLNLSAQDSITLQLKWWNQFQFAGYYAAQTQGYYAEEGLAVRIVPGGTGISPVEEVTSGRAQYGISGSDVVLQFSNGQPLVALGALFQHSPYTFMTLKERDLLEPSDLVGQTVMVSDDQGWAEMRAALILEGINPDSINIISHSWNNDDLVSGKADAISAYSTAEPWQLAEAGHETHLIRPLSYGIDFYGDVLFTSQEEVNNRPDVVEKFRRASFRGWQYAVNHHEEMIDYILTLPGVGERGVTRHQLLREAVEMNKIILPELIEVGHMNTGRWQHILSTYQMLGLAKSDATLDGFMYDQYKEQQSGYSRKLAYAGIILVLLSVLFLISYLTMKRIIRNTRQRLELEITSRHEAQLKLNTTEEFLDMAVKGATLGVWSLDVTQSSFTFKSAWKSMLGYDSEEVKIGRDMLLELIHPSDRDRIHENMNAHIDGKTESFEGTMRMRTKSGEWKWIHTKANARERNTEGIATRLTGIHLDIDEIKKKESELLHMSQELLRNNNDLRQFSYVISHNMRAPVASIAGLLQVIDPEVRDADKRDVIGKIQVCTELLMNTMEDLNDILNSKSATGKSGDSILVHERVMVLCEMFREQLDGNGARVDVDQRVQANIWFPTEVFDGVIMNLISNAIKFRNPKHLLHIEIFVKDEEHFVHLCIRDNGMGIDMEQFSDKLFGLYQRFHPKTTGKGLGLYISKTQMESLGGKIEVTSVLGKGTLFTVSFPKEPFCSVPERIIAEAARN